MFEWPDSLLGGQGAFDSVPVRIGSRRVCPVWALSGEPKLAIPLGKPLVLSIWGCGDGIAARVSAVSLPEQGGPQASPAPGRRVYAMSIHAQRSPLGLEREVELQQPMPMTYCFSF